MLLILPQRRDTENAFEKYVGYELNRFSKNPQIQNFMKIHSVGAELFHMDGQTNMTKLIGAFRNPLSAPNYY
jgi:hypothetical protein